MLFVKFVHIDEVQIIADGTWPKELSALYTHTHTICHGVMPIHNPSFHPTAK